MSAFRFRTLSLNICAAQKTPSHKSGVVQPMKEMEELATHMYTDRPSVIALNEVDVGTRRSGGANQPALLCDCLNVLWNREAGEGGIRARWQHVFVPSFAYDGGQYGVAILYDGAQFRAREQASWKFPGDPTAVKRGKKPALAEDVAVLVLLLESIAAPGCCVWVGTIHFLWDTVGLVQVGKLSKALQSSCQDAPVMLLGDWNMWGSLIAPDGAFAPDHDVERYVQCVQLLNAAGFADAGPGGSTHPRKVGGVKLDYCYVRPGGDTTIRCVNSGVLSSYAVTDHEGILHEWKIKAKAAVPVPVASVGVVEGFYWRPEWDTATGGLNKEFTHTQRRALLEYAAGQGCNVYVYGPKQHRTRNTYKQLSTWPLAEVEEWRATFALATKLGIKFVWAVSPQVVLDNDWSELVGVTLREAALHAVTNAAADATRMDAVLKTVTTGSWPSDASLVPVTPVGPWLHRVNLITACVGEVLALGAGGFAVLLDDTYSRSSVPPAKVIASHAGVIGRLAKSPYGSQLYTVCTPYYCGGPPGTSNTYYNEYTLALDEALASVGVPVPFVFTGVDVWGAVPSHPSVLPTGRQLTLWDNYITSDTLNRWLYAPMQPDTVALLCTGGGSVHSYLLSLAFPVERCVPSIHYIGEVLRGRWKLDMPADDVLRGGVWELASFLRTHRVSLYAQDTSVPSSLSTATHVASLLERVLVDSETEGAVALASKGDVDALAWLMRHCPPMIDVILGSVMLCSTVTPGTHGAWHEGAGVQSVPPIVVTNLAYSFRRRVCVSAPRAEMTAVPTPIVTRFRVDMVGDVEDKSWQTLFQFEVYPFPFPGSTCWHVHCASSPKRAYIVPVTPEGGGGSASTMRHSVSRSWGQVLFRFWAVGVGVSGGGKDSVIAPTGPFTSGCVPYVIIENGTQGRGIIPATATISLPWVSTGLGFFACPMGGGGGK